MIKENAMDTHYRVIGYGETEHGFYNHFNFFNTYIDAMVTYENHICNPEMDGAVVIEVQHESWRVIEEFDSGYPVSVECGPLGNHKITKSPKLVVV